MPTLLESIAVRRKVSIPHSHCYHHAPKVKLKAATAVVELLMIGMRKHKTSNRLEKLLHMVG